MRKKVNTLTRPEQRILEDMLFTEKEAITTGKWTAASFAEYAQNKMKRPVTLGNVQAAAKAFDIRFGGGIAVGRRLKLVAECKAAIKVLAVELVNLKGRLGETVSPEILALAEPSDESVGDDD